MEKALDACWINNEVISNNIVNAETPGYKRFRVYFEESLNERQNKFKISSLHKIQVFQ